MAAINNIIIVLLDFIKPVDEFVKETEATGSR